jgi:hypothetical protein
MIVSRIDPLTGKQCKWEFCKKIYVKCFIIFNPTGLDTIHAKCANNAILNGNFMDTTTVAGELGIGGIIGHWAIFKNLGGEGAVIVHDTIGAFDNGSVTAIGRKNHYAGIVQKVNLPANTYTTVEFEYRNWQNDNTPLGTVIDINLQPNPDNDLGAQNLHRVIVTNDTIGAWKRISFTVSKVNFNNKYFVICVQNDETGNKNSIISLDNIEICTSATTNAKDKEQDRIKFQVFPNPNTGDFNIELPIDANEKMKLRITDLTGRVLAEKQPTVGTTSQRIELNDLANGLYFIQVVQEGRVIGLERFVKQ